MKQEPAAGQAQACYSEFFGIVGSNLTLGERRSLTVLEPQRALGYAGAVTGCAAITAVPRELPLPSRKPSMRRHNPAYCRVWGKLAFWVLWLGLTLTWTQVTSAQIAAGPATAGTASDSPAMVPNKSAALPPTAAPD